MDACEVATQCEIIGLLWPSLVYYAHFLPLARPSQEQLQRLQRLKPGVFRTLSGRGSLSEILVRERLSPSSYLTINNV